MNVCVCVCAYAYVFVGVRKFGGVCAGIFIECVYVCELNVWVYLCMCVCGCERVWGCMSECV